MPPALDRLLASPSALRLLRSLVHCPACCKNVRRSHRNARPSATEGKWPHWEQPPRPRIYKNYDWNRADHADSTQADQTAQLVQELQRRERVYGLDGIRQVWDANPAIRLPTDDTLDAQFLWGSFLRHPDLVFPVLSHASYLRRKTGALYPHLYELCLGHWLAHRKRAQDALDFHRFFWRKLNVRSLPLRQLARLGRERFTLKAYEVLLEIYQTSNEKDLYDEVIPALLARGSTELVGQWHLQCVRRGDMPSPSVASHPLVQRLCVESTGLSDVEADAISDVAGAGSGKPSKSNEQLLRRVQGRDIAPIRLDDSTCARMFATRAFTPEAVIRGIDMVGVNEIGPLAVRAMAARAEPISELPLLFEELRKRGIALQGCVFSVALEKFAADKQWLVVRSMLDSDQHPDVYDDRKLQKELLDYYLQQGDRVQAHRTMAILTLFHNDPSTEAWNMLLQAHARPFRPRHILQTLQTMREQNIMLAPESVAALKGCLRRRQRGHRPVTGARFDDLRFVARAFTTVLEGGIAMIPPTMWREIIRRFGMLGRFRELRRLLFWLICWYAPRARSGTVFAALPKPPSLDAASEKLQAAFPSQSSLAYFQFPSHRTQITCVDHPIRQLFPPSFQQGLIVWGFRAGLVPNATLEQSMLPSPLAKRYYRKKLLDRGVLKRLDWSVGLRMLVRLREMGVQVHRRKVIQTLRMLMAHLFGPGQSRKKQNRMMHRANTLSYMTYIQEVNRIWGSPLFADPQVYRNLGLHMPMGHPRAARHMRRGGKMYLRDSLPAASASTQASGDTLSQSAVASSAPPGDEGFGGQKCHQETGPEEALRVKEGMH